VLIKIISDELETKHITRNIAKIKTLDQLLSGTDIFSINEYYIDNYRCEGCLAKMIIDGEEYEIKFDALNNNGEEISKSIYKTYLSIIGL